MDSHWADLISKLGFPIVIACWFMFRLERRMDKQIDLLNTIATRQLDTIQYLLKGKQRKQEGGDRG